MELYKTDISLINETKLNETVRDDEVDILGYDITRRDRITGWGISLTCILKLLLSDNELEVSYCTQTIIKMALTTVALHIGVT